MDDGSDMWPHVAHVCRVPKRRAAAGNDASFRMVGHTSQCVRQANGGNCRIAGGTCHRYVVSISARMNVFVG